MTVSNEAYCALVEIVQDRPWFAHKLLKELLPQLKVGEEETEEPKGKPRSLSQNRAIHLYREHLAQALNDAGFDMRKVLKAEVNIEWNKDMVRRYIWLPIQKALFDKDTSADLTSDEVTKVWEHINRLISERTGIHVPFPSNEALHNPRLTAMENLTRQDEEYPTHSPTAFDS